MLDDLKYTLDFNDVQIDGIDVIRRVFESNTNFINTRLDIENRFNIDLINRPSVDIGIDIARKKYCELNNIQWKDLDIKGTECGKIKLSECVDITDVPEEYNAIRDVINNEVFIPGYNTVETSFYVQNMKCKFGIGGLKAFYNSGFYEDVFYIDARSFYPSLMVNHNLHPQHLNKNITDIIREMMMYRFESSDEISSDVTNANS